MGKNIPIEAFTEPTMKIFLLLVGLLAKETLGQAKISPKISVDQRAPSTFENCNCQCNSDTWTDGQYIRGNCRSKDRNGALFCYVSGSALCSCRDVQVSSFLKNNQGRFKLYSYEACTTPPRNQCRNQGYNSNLGDGDFPYCSYNNNNFGNNNFGNNNFGGSSNYRPSGGISSSSGYRPGSSSSSGYRPGGSTSFSGSSSSGYRPGGSTSFGGSSSSVYLPGTGNGYNPPRNKPSLGDILSGVRTGSGSSGSSSSSGSSDSASSSGAINFDA